MTSIDVAGGSNSVSTAQQAAKSLLEKARPTVKESPAQKQQAQKRAAMPQNAPELEVDALKKAAEQFNEAMKQGHKNIRLSVSVHDGTNTIVTKVIDDDTGEVVREVPREKFLDLAANLQKLVGFVLDAAG